MFDGGVGTVEFIFLVNFVGHVDFMLSNLN